MNEYNFWWKIRFLFIKGFWPQKRHIQFLKWSDKYE